jgi:hypothetical protein
MTTTLEHSTELAELAAALIEVQKEVPKIPKTSDNPFFKSKYADLADVKTLADPIITKHGLAVTQWPSSNDRGDTLQGSSSTPRCSCILRRTTLKDRARL